MAGSFTPTSSYSNLTRLELEQLRKADFFAGSKALTVGDSGFGAENVVGVGSINAEPYFTGPVVALDDAYSQTPPTVPGEGLLTLTQLAATSSETVRWHGPQLVTSGTAGFASTTTRWVDNTPGLNFTTLGVLAGDILLVKQTTGGDLNSFTAATVSSILGPSTLLLSDINNPTNTPITDLDPTLGTLFQYVIVRPQVAQLFAVPGSGPLGREQTFLMVAPGSTLHTTVAPTLNQINTDRVRNIISSRFATSTAVDRADAVFGPPLTAGPRGSLDTLGYRVVLYKSNNTGTGPDLLNPIATLSPVIDSSKPAADQRMTIDHKAGVVRFSCAPRAGDDIKPSGGGVNPTTGRLQLYAVFWAIDQSATLGSSRSVYAVRSTTSQAKVPARIRFDPTLDVWRIGATNATGNFIVRAYDPLESTDPLDLGTKTDFGAFWGPPSDRFRGFRIRTGLDQIRFIQQNRADLNDPFFSRELVVADKTVATMGDGSAPSASPGGEYNPPVTIASAGYRPVASTLSLAVQDVAQTTYGGYGVVHLRRGHYKVDQTVVVPPGVTVEGEGAATVVEGMYNSFSNTVPSLFKFGPNNKYGTYDFGFDGTQFFPLLFNHAVVTRLEGFDIVWNPTRRVWGLFQADISTGALWFNEITTNGTKVLPGLGIDIKQSVTPFFTVASSNSLNHTSGHYPRASYQPLHDEYAVTWVEEKTIGPNLGPKVMLQVVQYVPGVTLASQFIRRYSGGAVEPFTALGWFSTHPSIAVNEVQTSANYDIALICWVYDFTFANNSRSEGIIDSSTGLAVLAQNSFMGPTEVVSSTDVAFNGRDDFVFVWSHRAHRVLRGTAGDSNNVTGYFTDAGHPTWAATDGVEIGSRFIYMNAGAANDKGRTGFVRGFGVPSELFIQFDGLPDTSFNSTVAGTIKWAIVPMTRMFGNVYDGSTTSFTAPPTSLAGPPVFIATATYYLAERETDYPRIARGGDRFIVVYQNFDTNAALNRERITNFDNGFNGLFADSGPAGFPLDSGSLGREHLSTSYLLLDQNPLGGLRVVGPTHTSGPGLPFFDRTDPYAGVNMGRDLEVINRSLGGRDPIVPHANLIFNSSRIHWDISARSHFALFTGPALAESRYPSMIPDVTWTGSDWTIVSPPVSNKVYSDSGYYYTSGPTTYFTDMSFYFGEGAQLSVDGSYRHRTVYIGDYIYFPIAGVWGQISAIHSEHTVELVAPVLGGGPLSNVQWYLSKQGFGLGTEEGQMKNPGFRVSHEGKILVSSSFITQADSFRDEDTGEDRQEMLFRNLWGDFTPTGPKFGSNVQQFMDQEGSRLKGDVTFKGVAVGAPKPINETAPEEPPCVAIAWGENFYAFADRVCRGSGALGPPINQVTVYRQSFGPYRSGLRNIRLMGSDNVSRGDFVITQRHVYTRHGGDSTPKHYFATDGYRNLFLHYAPQSMTYTSIFGGTLATKDARDQRSYQLNITAVMTDAIGRNPSRARIATAGGDFRDINPTSTPAARKYDVNAVRSVWTGKEFLCAFFNNYGFAVYVVSGGENNKAITDDLTQEVGVDGALFGVIPSSVAIGGVALLMNGAGGKRRGPRWDANVYGSLTDTSEIKPEAFDGILSDVAWSGRRMAVVWLAGINTTPGNGAIDLGGVVLGVSIIHPPGVMYQANQLGQTNISTYVIDYATGVGAIKGTIRDPKIVWDGHSFVISYVRKNVLAQMAHFVVSMPEDGYDAHAELQRVRPLNNAGTTSSHVNDLGTINSDGTIILPTGTSAHYMVQPGDIIHITRHGLAAGGGGNFGSGTFVNIAGLYVVQTVDARTGRVDVGVDLTQGAAISTRVYGAVYSAGVSGNANQTNSGSHDPDIEANYARASGGPAALAYQTYSNYVNQLSTNIKSLWATLYNEKDDEFVEFHTDGTSNKLVGVIWTRDGSRRKEVSISTATHDMVAAEWNGSNYFLVVGNSVIGVGDITCYVLSPSLAIERVFPLRTVTIGDLIGNSLGQVPGPGYGVVNSNHIPKGQLRSVFVRWNNRLNRWVVTASIVWSVDGFNPLTDSRYGTQQIASAAFSFSSFVNRTISVSAATFRGRTPGTRLIAQDYSVAAGPFLAHQNSGADPPAPGNSTVETIPTVGNGLFTGGTVFVSQPDVYLGTILRRDVIEVTNTSLVESHTRAVVQDSIRTGGIDYAFIEGALYPPIAVAAFYDFTAYRPFPKIMANVIDGGTISTDPIVTDTDSSEFTSVLLAGDMWLSQVREDVFMWTIGSKEPTVQVLDADEVRLEDVEFGGGEADIEERLINLARPAWQQGGLAVGSPYDDVNPPGFSTAVIGHTPHYARVFTTPAGKMETVRLTNVSSKAKSQYGWEGSKEPPRFDRYSSRKAGR